MTDFAHHYKEITPLETVQNVKDFFTNVGLTIIESDLNQSEAGTWYCHTDLYLNDIFIGGSNGKGMTKEYSLASCYAELYERFCNFDCKANHYVHEEIKRQNAQAGHPYKLRHDEKIVSYKDMIQIPIVKRYLDNLAGDNEKLKKACMDYWVNNEYIAYPYKNLINSNDTLYIDPRIAVHLSHSIGMAAGNTIEEALNQGLSELCEYVAKLAFYFGQCKNYYSINLNSIKSPEVQEKIQNLKKLGYDFYIFDFSYETGLPGVMSLLIDRKNGRLNLNFGAFPVFEIAVERVITELYQGIQSYRFNPPMKSVVQIPSRTLNVYDVCEIYANSISGAIFSVDFFDFIIEKDQCSSVYADPTFTNYQFNQYFCKLFADKNYKCYYCDNSLSDKIAAVHILLDAPDSQLYLNEAYNKDPRIQNHDLSMVNYLHKMCSTILNNDDNPEYLFQMIRHSSDFEYDGFFLGSVMMWNNFCISAGTGNEFATFSDLINNFEFGKIASDLVMTPIYVPFKKMVTLQRYLRTGLYLRDELKQMFNEIFDWNITDEDLQKCGDPRYMLKKVYCQPMVEYMHGDEFKNFCSIFVNR